MCVSHKKQTQNPKTSDTQTVNIQRCPQCVFFLPRQVCIYRVLAVTRLTSQPGFLTRQLDGCHPDATSAIDCCVRSAFASFQRKDHSNRRPGQAVTAVLGTFVFLTGRLRTRTAGSGPAQPLSTLPAQQNISLIFEASYELHTENLYFLVKTLPNVILINTALININATSK